MLATLLRLQLLRGEPPEGAVHLARLCAEGALEGCVSVALDVRPDELWGPLVAVLGGPAQRLKLLDVTDRPAPRLVISRGLKLSPQTWDVPDVLALVDRLNEFSAGEGDGRLIAVLGEWDDALQLWCLARPAVRALLREREFRPENLAELKRLATS